MANPNPEIWGDSTSWFYSTFAYGLTTDTAKIGNFDKPKVNNFGGTDNVNKSTLIRAIGQNKLVRNEYIDNTICPCGQAPDVSPFAKIAIFNENNDLSLTPRIYEITDSNINWFFADRVRQTGGAMASYSYYNTYYDSSHTEYSLAYQQFAPNTRNDADAGTSACMQLTPYVYYGIKSLLLSIEVNLMSPNAESPAQSSWRTLDRWKNDFSNYYCIGMRLFVRNCLSYNNNRLTYNDDEGISDGQASYLCVTNPIPVMNNGTMTPTQFLTQFQEGANARCAYIFNYSPIIYNYSDYRRARAVLPCWNYFEGQTINSYWYPSSDPIRYFFYKIPYNQANYNKMMSIAALFGCFFTPTNKYEFGYNMLDNDLYLTVLDENGVAHGQYTHGADNANNNLYSKNSIRDIDYDPTIPPTPVDPNTYSNTTGFNSLSSSAAMTRRYVLNAANVEKLGDDLWTICNDLATGGDFEYFDGKLKDEFLTTNPIDSIVSLQRFPFSIPHTFAPSKSAVRLGKNDGSAQGYLTNNPFNTIVFNGIDIFPRFGNCFLDYEPFTSYELYVPFCGTTKIRAADIIGHKLNLTMQIDLMTGNCTAYIMADQLVIETLNGSCGVDMQLSGIQSATVAANLYNGILGQQQAKTNMIAQGASALLPSSWVNPVGYAAKGEQAETTYKQATYAIEHTETPVHSIGSASALLAWVQEFDARLIIYYPEGNVISSAIPPSFNDSALAAFGHLKGFATVEPDQVSNYQMQGKAAFLQGDILAENIPCTQSERNKIKAFFAEGIYLPPIS